MSVPSLLLEPGHVDEPRAAQEYTDVLSQVAAEGKPVIVRRNGEDLAAVIPLEYLELLREVGRTPGSGTTGGANRLAACAEDPPAAATMV